MLEIKKSVYFILHFEGVKRKFQKDHHKIKKIPQNMRKIIEVEIDIDNIE